MASGEEQERLRGEKRRLFPGGSEQTPQKSSTSATETPPPTVEKSSETMNEEILQKLADITQKLDSSEKNFKKFQKETTAKFKTLEPTAHVADGSPRGPITRRGGKKAIAQEDGAVGGPSRGPQHPDQEDLEDDDDDGDDYEDDESDQDSHAPEQLDFESSRVSRWLHDKIHEPRNIAKVKTRDFEEIEFLCRIQPYISQFSAKDRAYFKKRLRFYYVVVDVSWGAALNDQKEVERADVGIEISDKTASIKAWKGKPKSAPNKQRASNSKRGNKSTRGKKK